MVYNKHDEKPYRSYERHNSEISLKTQQHYQSGQYSVTTNVLHNFLKSMGNSTLKRETKFLFYFINIVSNHVLVVS